MKRTRNALAIVLVFVLFALVFSGCKRSVPSKLIEVTQSNFNNAKIGIGAAEATPTPTPVENEVTPVERPTMWANSFKTVSVSFNEESGELHFALSDPDEDPLYNVIAPFSGNWMNVNDGTDWQRYRNQVSKIVVDQGITGIDIMSFMNLGHNIELELPDSIQLIDPPLNRYTTSFSKISVRGSGDNLIVDGNAVYLKNTNDNGYGLILYAGDADDTSFSLPSSFPVTSIAEGAFEYAYNLTSVDLSTNSSLASISPRAFYMCDALTSVKLPDTLFVDTENVFQACPNLTNIVGGGV